MNFFTSWRSHWTVGALYGVVLWFVPNSVAKKAVDKLDKWGVEREIAQHDDDLTTHQLKEATSWADGARFVRRV